jgi:hypothetical protein
MLDAESIEGNELETTCIAIHKGQRRNECIKLIRIQKRNVGDASLLRGYRGHPHLARPPSCSATRHEETRVEPSPSLELSLGLGAKTQCSQQFNSIQFGAPI